jgi:hypothetical protein
MKRAAQGGFDEHLRKPVELEVAGRARLRWGASAVSGRFRVSEPTRVRLGLIELVELASDFFQMLSFGEIDPSP